MIGADPAEGNLRSDPSAAGGEDAVTWTQVAKFSGRWEVGTFGAHIGALAAFYNEAIVMR